MWRMRKTTGNLGRIAQCKLRILAVGLLLAVASVYAGNSPDARRDAHATSTYSQTVRGLEQARVRPDGALMVRGRVSGSGEVRAGHVIIEGVLAPGDSPGCIDFGGNVTFNFTAVLEIEIGGTVPCSEHDRITVANTLTFNGPTLKLVLIDSFEPQYEDRFDVLDWGMLIGTFGIIDSSAATLSYPLVWDSSQLYLTGELVVGVQQIADGDLAPWESPDGQINGADLLIATQLVLGQRTAGPLQYAHGDMNLDDVINLADLLLIQQAVLQ